MRCKRHPWEQGVGVCATCLRERLLALIAAQAREAQPPVEDSRKSDPPPLNFPRSVSPYICRRSVDTDDDSDTCEKHAVYRTPQVGPTFSRRKTGRFSLVTSLFGTRSDETENDTKVPVASSSSWFSALFSGRRKKKSRLFSLEEVPGGGATERRPRRTRDQGMSPATGYGKDEEKDETNCSFGSEYSSDFSNGWRKSTPVTMTATAPIRRRAPCHTRNVSGIGFCLSPLVRASPNHRSQKPDIGFSGELRASTKHHLPSAASLCANRSRKMADFGRYP